MALTPEMGRKVGIAYRATLKRIKGRILSGGKFNFRTKEVRKLVASF